MKFILFFIAGIFSCLEGATQAHGSVLIIDVNIPVGADAYLLQLTHEKPYQLMEKREVKNNSRTIFNFRDSLPFWATVDIKNAKDSSLTNASLFLITKDTIRITFNTEDPRGIVKGGENAFIDKNKYLLFELPRSLYISEDYVKDIRKTYAYQTFSGYLYPRVNEYLANTLEVLQQYKDYYFVLEQLYEKREYFPLNFLDTSILLIDSSLHSTPVWKMLVTYIKREKQLLPDVKIPSFNIQDVNSATKKVEMLHRSAPYTYIDFWASWCVPCKEEMKLLKEIYKNIDTSKVNIVSVSIDEEKEQWLKANNTQKLPWESYIDYSGEAVKLLNITYIPQGFIINKEGKVIERFVRLEEFKNFANKINTIRANK